MPCAESLRIHAYFDKEMDAMGAVDIERHLAGCEACRALLQELEKSREALRHGLTNFRAPAELCARIASTIEQEETAQVRKSPRATRPALSFWLGAFSGMVATAVAAFMLFLQPFNNAVVDEVLTAHVQSLMTPHLIDVESTDKHTVKPWFAGRINISPVVADFESQGYKLIGGRVDDLDRHRSAVVVYQHGKHIINVFSWADDHHSMNHEITRRGYHMIFWNEGDIEYCAVSDTAWNELRTLTVLMQEVSRLAGEFK